jgi:hypothetical protein
MTDCLLTELRRAIFPAAIFPLSFIVERFFLIRLANAPETGSHILLRRPPEKVPERFGRPESRLGGLLYTCLKMGAQRLTIFISSSKKLFEKSRGDGMFIANVNRYHRSSVRSGMLDVAPSGASIMRNSGEAINISLLTELTFSNSL